MNINIIEKEMTTKKFFETFFEFEKLEKIPPKNIFSIPKKYLKRGTIVCRYNANILQNGNYISVECDNKTLNFYDLSFLNKMINDKSYCLRYYKMIRAFCNIKLTDVFKFEILSGKDRIFKFVSEDGTQYIFEGDSDVIITEEYQNLLNFFKKSLESNTIETEDEVLNYILLNKKLEYHINKVVRNTWDEASVRMRINSHGEMDYNKSLEEVRKYKDTLVKFAKESLAKRYKNANQKVSSDFLYPYKIRFHRDFSLIITFRIKGCDY